MRRFLVYGLFALVALVVWSGAFVIGTAEGWWIRPIAPAGNTRAFADAAIAEIDRTNKGNVAFVLLASRKLVAEHFKSVGRKVYGETLFQVASLSKWITAWGVMTLVESGKIGLDVPVSRYLKRWHLPPSKFDNNGVTVRRLLSHTAGLTDGLGFAGFGPQQKAQTIVQSLTSTADAMPFSDGHVRVGYAPGTDWQYSGGGFAILQLLVEDVSGEPFNTYMTRAVLAPLGMTRSTFVLPQNTPNVFESYDGNGKLTPYYTYAVVAAASLYTNTNDLTRFVLAQTTGANGEQAGRGVLKPASLAEMRTPVGYKYGLPIYGLGTLLYAQRADGSFVVGHDGENRPVINTTARIDPQSGDGIIVLQTGNPSLATNVGGEWVFWHTGHLEPRFIVGELQRLFPVLAGGWIAIIAASILIGLTRGRRPKSAPSASA